MKVRILARAVTHDSKKKQILLVKNKGANFWYAPGGGWEYEHETIKQCVVREVLEETGLNVKIQRLLYMQEFHESEQTIFFETFWLAKPTHNQTLNNMHIDQNGIVETAKWFNQKQIQDVKVFPERLKSSFWHELEHNISITEDPFIGVS
ncbi:MAG: NUDIX hydrolase [Candidatus Woesebacteria bacterium]|jgi:ADP-ribose pyrophosphatase YjhB (NUDIX family)